MPSGSPFCFELGPVTRCFNPFYSKNARKFGDTLITGPTIPSFHIIEATLDAFLLVSAAENSHDNCKIPNGISNDVRSYAQVKRVENIHHNAAQAQSDNTKDGIKKNRHWAA